MVQSRSALIICNEFDTIFENEASNFVIDARALVEPLSFDSVLRTREDERGVTRCRCRVEVREDVR